ncbi:HD domain-containing protein [Candidatus Woesearchaeota archaeon]|nr:HD domain-containing protein [Candidatus Woesearchaeota archaeon]
MTQALTFTDRVYGEVVIDDPLVLQILETPPMIRIKGVNQYGAYRYTMPWMQVSRFEHCVGVYLILRKFGASREEQIAGLLHDVAHTAFSHVIDYVLGQSDTQEVHEQLHHFFLFDSAIVDLVKKEGLDIHRLIDEKQFSLLEQPIPELCADRLDYFLRDSLALGAMTKAQAHQILSSLIVREGKFMFSSLPVALEASQGFMSMGTGFWGSLTQRGIYQLMADAIKKAMEHKIITLRDMVSTDDEAYRRLMDSHHPSVVRRLSLLNPSIRVEAVEEKEQAQKEEQAQDTLQGKSHLRVHGKARYIDPLVVSGGQVHRLSSLVPEFSAAILAVKQQFSKPALVCIPGLGEIVEQEQEGMTPETGRQAPPEPHPSEEQVKHHG